MILWPNTRLRIGEDTRKQGEEDGQFSDVFSACGGGSPSRTPPSRADCHTPPVELASPCLLRFLLAFRRPGATGSPHPDPTSSFVYLNDDDTSRELVDDVSSIDV